MQSHQNDPLGAAIVAEVIKTIKDDDLILKAEANGATFLEKLQTIKDDLNVVDVRGRGLMFAIDIRDEKKGDRIYRKLLNRGYIVCNRKALFRIDPPLSINENEFFGFIRELKNILKSQ